MMPSPRLTIAGLVLLGLSSGLAPAARASALYRCDAPDGSVAYVGSPKGYQNCKVLSTFAEPPPKPRAAAAPKPAVAPPRRGWVYEENKADFSNVAAVVASAPPDIVRADFRTAAGGVVSSAPVPPSQDFSTVLADVASSAPTVGKPLFIAAPYRMPARPAVERETVAAAAEKPATPSASRVLRGAVYKVARKDGITEYTNIKPQGNTFAVLFTYIATCIACDVHSKIDFARTALNLDAYKDVVAAAAADYGVERALLRAVIHAESAFNPLALSNKGAQGLMQLMPGTAGDLGVADAFDAEQNIRGGARYLAQLLKAFNGDARLATAAYNAGPGAVQKYGGVPPYDETRVYVERVATLRDRYQKAL